MRSPWRAVAVCSAALFVPLLIPLFTGRVFTADDLAAFHIPFPAPVFRSVAPRRLDAMDACGLFGLRCDAS